ncbi:MAG: DUF1003 domain-containing protein [Rickettsiales bacterium]|jgi:uncharacterized membrane protein|nr:DUF1003 domain-containing protein [Rickettsiales bacterium]
MPKKDTKYMKKLLDVQNAHQKMMNQIVVNAIEEQEDLVNRLLEEEHKDKLTMGQRISDAIASFGGSWPFIFLFFIVLFGWMSLNTLLHERAFDPYPYILLNLVLSCVAAIQAPIILMSQNRRESRESKRAQDAYLINLKSELENKAMDQKLNLLINEEFHQLIEIQKIQIGKLEDIELALKKIQRSSK